jgi:putative transposase
MARGPRIVIPNCPHHVTQRGNNRQDVFFSDVDREIYLKLLKKYTAAYHVDVLGYCLMTNHVHIIVTPATPDALSRAIGLTHNDYSRWLHIRRSESGHLWGHRFYSCPIESRYLSAVLAYVERNPVRAGLVPHCDAWHWSSAQAHLATSPHPSHDWLNLTPWATNWTPTLWHTALEDGLSEAEMQARILEATRTGHPLGDPTFIETIKQQLAAAAH